MQAINKHVNCGTLPLPVAAVVVVSFPFDMEGPNFATGALKVNPVYKETNQRNDHPCHVCNLSLRNL